MNCTELDVLLSPAEFEGLPEQDLSDSSCVVFDVLRATSTMTVALANGAEAILPCATIGEAIAARESEPGLLLAGERGGQRITAEISGGTEFDLGNSPREMTRDVVAEKRMAATTTNGTRALKACSGSKAVWIGSFLNLTALGQAIRDANPKRLLLVCAGTGEASALEDALGAGALCDLLGLRLAKRRQTHPAWFAIITAGSRAQLLAVACEAKNARHLLKHLRSRAGCGVLPATGHASNRRKDERRWLGDRLKIRV